MRRADCPRMAHRAWIAVALAFAPLLAGCGSEASSGGSNGGAGGSGGGAGSSGTGSGGSAGSGAGGSGGSSGSAGSSGTIGAGGSVAGGYCAGETPWPAGSATCRTSADCTGDEMCFADGPPDTTGVCGGCLPPDNPCSSDSECGDGICGPFDDPCHCFGGQMGACTSRCTDGSCPDGQRCAANGHCQTVRCDDGWSCAAGERCAVGGLGADAHGCQSIPCSDGWSCPSGWSCEPDGPVRDLHGCRKPDCHDPGGTPCAENLVCEASLSSAWGCNMKKCTTVDDCDCGACVDGKCRRHPGVCAVPGGPS